MLLRNSSTLLSIVQVQILVYNIFCTFIGEDYVTVSIDVSFSMSSIYYHILFSICVSISIFVSAFVSVSVSVYDCLFVFVLISL